MYDIDLVLDGEDKNCDGKSSNEGHDCQISA